MPFQSLNPVNSGHFSGIFGHFPGEIIFFRSEIAPFQQALSCIAVFCVFFRAHRRFFCKCVLFSNDKGILHFCGIVFFSEGELICKVFREIYTPR